MESAASTSTPRFRFRDHNQDMAPADDDDDSTEGLTTSDSSSLSSPFDAGADDVQSMTAKGIKHLCSELVELKKESDEDFQKSIFSSYSAFLSVFEEMRSMESEMMQLRYQLTTQKKLIKLLSGGTFFNVLSDEMIESMLEDVLDAQITRPSILKTHTEEISDILDTLLSEHRLDEALSVLDMESRSVQSMHLLEQFSSDELMRYNSVISEKKAMLADQLTLLAENHRVSAPELQKALVGLGKLGCAHLATQLLFKYYHSRIASGMQYSKALPDEVYIRQLTKVVFSVISQAAKGFLALHGETSPYDSELIRWASQETVAFGTYLNSYVKSVSETSGGLSKAVEAVQCSVSYCSLLEAQRVVLQPTLLKHIRPYMEEVLEIHIDHFKKVISILASTDTWVLCRYLTSGILTEGDQITQNTEFCLLSSSGRKFVTLFQAITEDILPLMALQMEGSILKGLFDLFSEYVVILETALTCGANVIERNGSEIHPAESQEQKVFAMANLSTLIQFFSHIIRRVFHDSYHLKFEIDSYIMFIQDTKARFTSHFCEQFVHKQLSSEDACGHTPDICIIAQDNADMFDLVPSVSYQALYLELKRLRKLAEDQYITVDWLTDLFREVMETLFTWISSNEQTWTITEEDAEQQNFSKFMQFCLDVEFLVETARHGGYLSNNIMDASLDIVSRMESAFISAGLNPKRDVEVDGWAINSAIKAIRKLEELQEVTLRSKNTDNHVEETNGHNSMPLNDLAKEDDDDAHSQNDSVVSLEVTASSDASIVKDHARLETSKAEGEPSEVNLQTEEEICSNSEGETERVQGETCLTVRNVVQVQDEDSITDDGNVLAASREEERSDA